MWWQVTGGSACEIDRWYGRDVLLRPNWGRRLFIDVGCVLALVAGLVAAAFGSDVGIVVRLWSIWVAFLILAGGWLGDIRMMESLRRRRLASIGFSPGGVPVEWLPPPPEPPKALPSS